MHDRCTNPRRGVPFGVSRTEIAMTLLMVGFLVSGWFLLGLAGGSHSTESLILAQDERWRRA